MGRNWQGQQERFGEETFNNLRHDYGRKCCEWKECHRDPIIELPPEVYNALDKLDVTGTIPFDGLPEEFADSIFIAVNGDQEYLVNTEGFSYSRYIARVSVDEEKF